MNVDVIVAASLAKARAQQAQLLERYRAAMLRQPNTATPEEAAADEEVVLDAMNTFGFEAADVRADAAAGKEYHRTKGDLDAAKQALASVPEWDEISKRCSELAEQASELEKKAYQLRCEARGLELRREKAEALVGHYNNPWRENQRNHPRLFESVPWFLEKFEEKRKAAATQRTGVNARIYGM